LCKGIDDNQREHLEVKGAGHYGIFSGRRWREVVYPQVKTFILEHSNAAGTTSARKSVATTTAKSVPVAAANKGTQAKAKTSVKPTAAKTGAPKTTWATPKK
jgi:poly(3-hydroxybutyrate) depolymerase